MTAKTKRATAPAPKAPTTVKLQRHPLSEKFSLPNSEEERLALASDMRDNGQHQEIITYEGMVLDGWERYMGCLQMGLTPKFKQYEGSNPAAVAFGANAIRRKLNSVQKALFGAKYFMHIQAEGSNITQKMVAKASCCSLQRLNEIVQLLRKVDTDAKAAKCVSDLNTNPDITTAMLQSMLVDVGIIDANARKPAAGAPAPTAGGGDDSDDDLDLDDALDASDDSNVDLLGGADIDDLLDDDGEDGKGTPTPRGDKGTVTTSGKRIGHDKRSRETPASSCAKDFKALTEPERIDFVKFAWNMLRPAVDARIEQGRVEWPLLHATADAGKAALADMTSLLAPATKPKPGAKKPVEAAKPTPAPAKRNAVKTTPAAAPAVAAKGKPAPAKRKRAPATAEA